MNAIRPAVVAVGYNRPHALQRLLDSLARAAYPEGDVPLIISIDKSANEAEVTAVADAFIWQHGSKTVRTFETRQGLRSHVLQCGDLSQTYGAVILLEDDLIVSPAYYHYAEAAFVRYADAPCVAGIALYSHAWNGYANYQFIPVRNGYDSYLGQFSVTWGQCWSAAQWKEFRAWYAQNSGKAERLYDRIPEDVASWPETSWGKYFACYLVETDKFYVMPYTALSTNCEEAGQHAAGDSDAHQVPLLRCNQLDWRFAPVEDAVRYDLFFERIGLPMPEDCDVAAEDVCVDLHGTKRQTFGKRYFLTTRHYPLPVAHSYGLRLRPIEENVTAGMPGDVIRLYDAAGGLPVPADQDEYRRMQYELYRFDWRRLLRYSVRTLWSKGLGRVRRMLGRKA